MKILHSSDLHGKYKQLLSIKEPFDVWVDTGDFFPTAGRRHKEAGGRIDSRVERKFQLDWCNYKTIGQRLSDWLDGRTLMMVPGNHDFIPLENVVKHGGGNAIQVSHRGNTHQDILWAGFRDVPYINGEWEGEAHDFTDVVNDIWDTNPQILLTHAPPTGILADKWGIPDLSRAFREEQHNIKHHFFGHVHERGGMKTFINDVWHYNGATRIHIHDIQI